MATPYLALTNRLYEVVVSNHNCINNWGVYLFNRDFDDEPELRNKAGTIWLCSLLDTLKAQLIQLPKIEAEAKANGWDNLIHASTELIKFCDAVSALLSRFSRKEQIFLVDFRNQLVHSYLAARHRDRIRVKYCSNGKLESEEMNIEDWRKIQREFHEPNRTVDEIVSEMLPRALDLEQPYWRAVSLFQRKLKEMYELMQDQKRFVLQF